MTKKTLVIILGVLACFSSGAMAAQTIVWVSNNTITGIPPAINDQGFLDVLTAAGYTVTREVITASTVPLPADVKARLQAADIIIMSRTNGSGNFGDLASWNGFTKPLITLMPHLARTDGTRWKWMNITSVSDGLAKSNLTAVVPTHPIFAGVTLTANQVDITTTTTSFPTVTTAGNGTILAKRASDNNVWIVLWNAGTEFFTGSGQFAGGPRMLFCLGEKTSSTRDGVYNLNDEGKKLFLNAIKFLAPDPTFNPAPKVIAAPKYSRIYAGGTVQLSGTVTDQPPLQGDPGVLSWYWKKYSGPGTVTFVPDTTAKDPTVSFSAKGMYTLYLQATDGTKDANDVVNVYVADRADEKIIGYWDMENTLEDKSVNSNDGALYYAKKPSVQNRFTSDAAIGTSAIDLANTDPLDTNAAFVYLGKAPELEFTTGGPGDFTVTAWVKTSALTGQENVFSKGGDGTNGIRHMLSVGEAGAGRVDQVTDDNVTKVEAVSLGTVNDGKWHFIAGQRYGNLTRVYVDGQLAATANLPGVSYNLSGTSQQGAYIGVGIQQEAVAGVANTEPNNVNAKWFVGKIDDVRVYNYPLALTDTAGFDSIRTLAAMGYIPAAVNAGPDGSFLMKPGLSYQLAGVVTDYGKPDIQTILWTTVSSNPAGSEAVFAAPSSPTSTVTFPVAGVYTLKLTVIDATGTIEDTVVITATTPSCADVKTAGLLMKTDLNGDCKVDIQDLAIMLQNWTKCNDPENVNCIWPF
jgi:hypothetical protein